MLAFPGSMHQQEARMREGLVSTLPLYYTKAGAPEIHAPNLGPRKKMARLAGIEPATPGLEVPCSIPELQAQS